MLVWVRFRVFWYGNEEAKAWLASGMPAGRVLFEAGSAGRGAKTAVLVQLLRVLKNTGPQL